MTMEHIRLNTGQMMPRVGLGTSGGLKDVMRKALRTALECGYRSIDTAYVYNNEEAIGEELQEWFSKGKLKREDVFVISKLPAAGNRKSDVTKFLTSSLERLRLDYLDLYLVHFPCGVINKDNENLIDHETDIQNVWKTMEEQVDAGLVKAIGVSNFNSEQIDRIIKIARIHPSVNQVESHLYMQQCLLREKCEKLGIVMCAYSPLGAPNREEGANANPAAIAHPAVLEIASNHGKTTAQVLLKFLLQKNFVIIPKSTTEGRIRKNFQLFDFSLSEMEMSTLSALDRGKAGRVFNFRKIFPGIENHKEYPFHIPF